MVDEEPVEHVVESANDTKGPAWCFNKQVVRTTADRGYACFLLNIVIPGSGTMLSSAFAEGPYRWDVLLLGFVQLLCAPLLLIGWVWSINHGVAIFDISEGEKNAHPED